MLFSIGRNFTRTNFFQLNSLLFPLYFVLMRANLNSSKRKEWLIRRILLKRNKYLPLIGSFVSDKKYSTRKLNQSLRNLIFHPRLFPPIFMGQRHQVATAHVPRRKIPLASKIPPNGKQALEKNQSSFNRLVHFTLLFIYPIEADEELTLAVVSLSSKVRYITQEILHGLNRIPTFNGGKKFIY